MIASIVIITLSLVVMLFMAGVFWAAVDSGSVAGIIWSLVYFLAFAYFFGLACVNL